MPKWHLKMARQRIQEPAEGVVDARNQPPPQILFNQIIRLLIHPFCVPFPFFSQAQPCLVLGFTPHAHTLPQVLCKSGRKSLQVGNNIPSHLKSCFATPLHACLLGPDYLCCHPKAEDCRTRPKSHRFLGKRHEPQ